MWNREDLNEMRDLINPAFAVYNAKQKDREEVITKIHTLEKNGSDISLLMAYFNKIVDNRRKGVIDKVIGLVSYGLQTILEDPTYSLKLDDSKMQRSQKFYNLTLVQGDKETPILNSVGGGVVNLLSFLLRVVLLSVSSNRKFLVLDEPFAALSKNYRENIGQFLQYLCEKTGMQILTVSHQEEIDEAADVLYKLKSEEGEVKVVRVV